MHSLVTVMGNTCDCVCRQTNDDAVDTLLEGYEGEMTGQPRGPPPPYQVHFFLLQSIKGEADVCD